MIRGRGVILSRTSMGNRAAMDSRIAIGSKAAMGNSLPLVPSQPSQTGSWRQAADGAAAMGSRVHSNRNTLVEWVFMSRSLEDSPDQERIETRVALITGAAEKRFDCGWMSRGGREEGLIGMCSSGERDGFNKPGGCFPEEPSRGRNVQNRTGYCQCPNLECRNQNLAWRTQCKWNKAPKPEGFLSSP